MHPEHSYVVFNQPIAGERIETTFKDGKCAQFGALIIHYWLKPTCLLLDCMVLRQSVLRSTTWQNHTLVRGGVRGLLTRLKMRNFFAGDGGHLKFTMNWYRMAFCSIYAYRTAGSTRRSKCLNLSGHCWPCGFIIPCSSSGSLIEVYGPAFAEARFYFKIFVPVWERWGKFLVVTDWSEAVNEKVKKFFFLKGRRRLISVKELISGKGVPKPERWIFGSMMFLIFVP